MCIRDSVDQARRLLEHIGWTGFANFDLKYDPRDGRTVFFELNPRLGRSNFYVTAAGRNTVELYVREYVQDLDPLPPGAAAELTTEHLYTCLLYTSDAADDLTRVDLGGRRIIKKKKKNKKNKRKQK